MKQFFAEFKKFITRGNVLDMAVGVIVGSSFTAIVNALSNNILKPLINALLAKIFGADSLSKIYTFLVEKFQTNEAGEFILDEAGNYVHDLTKSIYIDWGAFINAVINFLLVALVLFCIVKFFNKLREGNAKMKSALNGKISKEDRLEMKKQGIKRKDKAAVEAYFAEKARKEEEAKLAAEAKAKADREANPTTEDLLKQIVVLLK
ncbi:MAG: large conductance mechanosensitive channel protein MscL, partial [Clostridia bacterium]|nr:large conductance mechanosensitive channel protein MscL [Clostridia bacterium]